MKRWAEDRVCVSRNRWFLWRQVQKVAVLQEEKEGRKEEVLEEEKAEHIHDQSMNMGLGKIRTISIVAFFSDGVFVVSKLTNRNIFVRVFVFLQSPNTFRTRASKFTARLWSLRGRLSSVPSPARTLRLNSMKDATGLDGIVDHFVQDRTGCTKVRGATTKITLLGGRSSDKRADSQEDIFRKVELTNILQRCFVKELTSGISFTSTGSISR